MANVRYPGTAGTTPGTIPASDVTYDNTISGLTADDVQEAIDEIEGQISTLSYDASDISYDNTTSGLTADDVQEAIDEIDGNLDTLSGKVYKTDDSAITDIASDDLLPIYDTSATATKKITLANVIKATVSNPNLVDNAWFTVNQRGAAQVTSAYTYFVDRWKSGSVGDGITQNADKSITLEANTTDSSVLYQVFESDKYTSLLGKTVTASILLSSGVIEKVSFVLPSSKYNSWHRLGSYDNDNLEFALDDMGDGTCNLNFSAKINNTITVKAVKFEPGSISTLGMDIAPNYATELLKCQRYFFKPVKDADGRTPYQAMGFHITGVTGFFFPSRMRVNPTVTVTSITEFASMTVASTTGIAAVTQDGVLYVYDGTGPFTVGDHYFVDFEASADL